MYIATPQSTQLLLRREVGGLLGALAFFLLTSSLEEKEPLPLARILSEACSATATIIAEGFVETIPGNTEASTTKRFCVP